MVARRGPRRVAPQVGRPVLVEQAGEHRVGGAQVRERGVGGRAGRHVEAGERRDRLAVERAERPLERHAQAREARRVAQRVRRRLGPAQALDEVEERADVVGVERDDELLVVEAEGVRRVVVDLRVLAPDLDVVLHHAVALLGAPARTTARVFTNG